MTVSSNVKRFQTLKTRAPPENSAKIEQIIQLYQDRKIQQYISRERDQSTYIQEQEPTGESREGLSEANKGSSVPFHAPRLLQTSYFTRDKVQQCLLAIQRAGARVQDGVGYGKPD